MILRPRPFRSRTAGPVAGRLQPRRGCQSRNAAFSRIQDAIDAAADGDIIDVCAGVHRESAIFIYGKSLTIQGQGRSRTFVEPPVPSPIFSVFGPVEVAFQSLTLRNGEDFSGGALHIVHGDVSLADCDFRGNSAVESGGAVSLDRGSTLVVSNCLFEDNVAGAVGGAIHARRPEDVILTASIFTHNAAGDGGALEISGAGGVVINACEFIGNTAEFSGGALVVADSESLLLTGSAVTDNRAGRFGGIRLEDLARDAVIEGCAIRHNASTMTKISSDPATGPRAGLPGLELVGGSGRLDH